MTHVINVIFWQNYGVGNFTASAVTFISGYLVGRRHYNRHVKPAIDKIHAIHASVTEEQ